MRRLTVVYDGACAVCIRCRDWLAAQPAWVELEFLPARSARAASRLPARLIRGDRLVAVDDRGGVYLGPDAFLLCLWALKEWRELSLDLGLPPVRPFARRAIALLSSLRGFLSALLPVPC